MGCLHREIQPARQCRQEGCDTWLASANGSDFCSLHGGWLALEIKRETKASRDDRADLYSELVEMING